ncbi:MAG: carbon-nitrogen hydrolase family protein [Bacteroidota bacterium]
MKIKVLFLIIAFSFYGLSACAQSSNKSQEVWIATVSQHGLKANTPAEMNEKLLDIIEEIVPMNPDIVVLPEVAAFAGLPKRPPLAESAELPYGPITKPYAEYAKRNKCYVIIPTYTKDKEGRFYNSSVLFDREGEYVGEYRKIYPTVSEMERGITPGPLNPPVFETDFGTIAMQICFDNEFVDGWRKLEYSDVDIVFFSSAYSGGRKLNSVATLFNYNIVSSTRKNGARIIDKAGNDVISTGTWAPHWVCAPINLNQVVVSAWPGFLKFSEIQKKYGKKVKITNHHLEEFTIIESLDPKLKASDVLKEFGLESRQEYLIRVEEIQNKRRVE